MSPTKPNKFTTMKTNNTNNRTQKAVNILTGVIFTALSIVLIIGVSLLIIDMFSTGLKYY